MKNLYKYLLPLLLLIFFGLLGSAYYRVAQERASLLDDLDRRARVIAKSLAPSSSRTVKKPPNLDEEEIKQRFPKGYNAVKPYLRLTPQPE